MDRKNNLAFCRRMMLHTQDSAPYSWLFDEPHHFSVEIDEVSNTYSFCFDSNASLKPVAKQFDELKIPYTYAAPSPSPTRLQLNAKAYKKLEQCADARRITAIPRHPQRPLPSSRYQVWPYEPTLFDAECALTNHYILGFRPTSGQGLELLIAKPQFELYLRHLAKLGVIKLPYHRDTDEFHRKEQTYRTACLNQAEAAQLISLAEKKYAPWPLKLEADKGNLRMKL